jgi:branched-chain amino acid transport system ATP-binding protein
MLADDKIAVILVEQHADIALSLTDRVILLERGQIVHSGPSAELARDTATLDRYIGLSIAKPV